MSRHEPCQHSRCVSRVRHHHVSTLALLLPSSLINHLRAWQPGCHCELQCCCCHPPMLEGVLGYGLDQLRLQGTELAVGSTPGGVIQGHTCTHTHAGCGSHVTGQQLSTDDTGGRGVGRVLAPTAMQCSQGERVLQAV